MAGNAWPATLIACSDRVEGPGRQQAPEQNRDVSGDRDAIARLRPPAFYRVGEFGRDRLRPKLESLAAACLEPRYPRAISLAMRRAFEIDVAAIKVSRACSRKREAIGPGSINVTQMPPPLSSRRSASARASMANFEAQ